MSPVTEQIQTPCLLKSNVFNHGDVSGLDVNYNLQNILPIEIRSKLILLHKQIQISDELPERIQLQKQIDQYLLVAALYTSNAPLSRKMQWQDLLLPLHIDMIPSYDLGVIIRDITMKIDDSNSSIMFKIVQYCIPYIKHNRLTFPEFKNIRRNDLVSMIQMILATCLGVYPHAQRKPTWHIRVSIFWMIWQFLEKGNEMDLYMLCRDNVSILRLAIIEYFIYIIDNFMPVEKSFMDNILGLSCKTSAIFTQFLVIIDAFRANALQDTVFDFTEINSKAQVGIEKCNRVCKGKSRSVCRVIRSDHELKYHENIVKQAMALPYMDDSISMQTVCMMRKLKYDELLFQAQSII